MRSLIATFSAISVPIVFVGNLVSGQYLFAIFGSIFWLVIYLIAKPKY